MSVSRSRSRRSESSSTRSKDKRKRSKLNDEDDEEDDEEAELAGRVSYGEDDEFYQKWAGPVLIGPFLPALFSLFIIVAGQLVLNTWTGTCGYDLPGYISAQIAVCYLFLLVFSWVYLGEDTSLKISALDIDMVVLRPFKSMKWIMYFYFGVLAINFIVAIYGAYVVALSVFCKKTAPMLYTFSLFLLVTFWLGLFVLGCYAVKFFFGDRINALIKEQMREDTLEEAEERVFRRTFDDFDPERVNKIRTEDVPPMLQALGVFVPDEEIVTLKDTFDPQSTGFVEYAVFCEWFKDLNRKADAQMESLNRKATDIDEDEN